MFVENARCSVIIFDKVTKTFADGFTAVSDLSFEILKGEILVFLGKSGSGKTTALRLINRLIDPTSGHILLDSEEINSLDPIKLRRKIGYAIQHIGLFLHMTVAENIGIVPSLLGWSKSRTAKRVDELLQMMGFTPSEFRDLYPRKLSGGQKQRIGVARALAADPPIILMDEPFGALDPLMREQLQNEFLEIQSKIRKTIVFVTHDLSEAVKMGDRIAVLDEGKLIQLASPQELIDSPANSFIDAFLGKDRLQLLLQTKSLQSMMADLSKKEKKDHPQLQLKSTLMEALLAYKLQKCETLSIFDEKKYVGELPKEKLVQNLVDSL